MYWMTISIIIMVAVPVLGQTPIPVGAEFQVNSYTTEEQKRPAVGMDGLGNFVVVWRSHSLNRSVFSAQRYDASGGAQGSELQIDFVVFGGVESAVGMMTPGEFVVVWEDDDGSYYGPFAKRYDSMGQPGSEFQVNTYTTFMQWYPVMGTNSSGGFVVVWESRDVIGNGTQDGSGAGVFGQLFSSPGIQVGSEFQVNTYTTGNQYDAAVGMNASGAFVVVWTSGDLAEMNVFAQRYDSLGNLAGGEFQVNSYTTGPQRDPAAGMDAAGNFVVVWTGGDNSGNNQDGNKAGIFARRFDSQGQAVAGEFQVNSYNVGSQRSPAVAMEGAGDFVVVWSSGDPPGGQDGSAYGIFGQRFDSQAQALGLEFQVNTVTAGNQDFASISTSGTGSFIVAWESGSFPGQDIAGQRFRIESGIFADGFESGGTSAWSMTVP